MGDRGQSTPIQLAQVIGIDGQTGSLKNQDYLALLKPYPQRDGAVNPVRSAFNDMA